MQVPLAIRKKLGKLKYKVFQSIQNSFQTRKLKKKYLGPYEYQYT